MRKEAAVKLPRRIAVCSLYVVALSVVAVGWLSNRQTAEAVCQDNEFLTTVASGSYLLQQKIIPFEDPNCTSNRYVDYYF